MNAIHKMETGWARRRAERRTAILDGALQLVIDEGIDGFGINRLARALGYTPGALYRYFPSREALLAEVESSVIARFDAYLRAAEADIRAYAVGARSPKRIRPVAALLGVAALYAALSKELAEEFCLLALFVGDPRPLVPDEHARTVMREASAILQLVAELFVEAEEARALRSGDPVERAGVYWAALHGVLQTRKLMRVSALVATDQMAKTTPRTLLAGWGATAKTMEAAEDLLAEVEAARPLIARAVPRRRR